MKQVLAVLAAVAIVALTATVIYQGTSWASTQARLDRTERTLKKSRDKVVDLTDNVAALEREKQDMLDAEAEQLALTTGYHDPEFLARDYKREMNKDVDPGLGRVEDVGCIAQDDENRDFVCMVEWANGSKLSARVDVAADGSSWISRSES